MKKVQWLLVVALALLLVSGCATSYPMGSIYTDLKLPVAVTADPATNLKVGTATCRSILGLVALGDVSIETAAKNGGITQIHHVDWEAKSVLGIVSDYKITVYGK
ncbi:MAG: TRL-like family protein [Kiritimatiellae bacterium]|nr:TRL-like family protein [Kiritimatiellia bacterium]